MEYPNSLNRVVRAATALEKSLDAKFGVFAAFEKQLSLLHMNFKYEHHFLNDGIYNHYLLWDKHPESKKIKGPWRVLYSKTQNGDLIFSRAICELTLEDKCRIFPYFSKFIDGYAQLLEKKQKEFCEEV